MSLWNPIVTVSPGGEDIRLSKKSLTILDSGAGRAYQYYGVITDVTIPAISPGESRSTVSVPVDALSPTELRDAGIVLGGAKAEIAMWREGDDWKDRVVLLTGRVLPNGVRRNNELTTLELADWAEELDRPFPPYVITREGFPTAQDNIVGKTMNVLYGNPVTDVPVQQLQDMTPDVTSVDFLIAGHRLGAKTVRVKPQGSDAFIATVNTGFDYVSGATYSFFTATTAQIQGDSNIVADVFGHANMGSSIVGLGDVVEHAIRTYSGLPAGRIDGKRLGLFVERANRLKVASMFGGDVGGTVIGILTQRFSDPLGIRLGFRNGLFGADLLPYDPFATPVQKLGSDILLDQIGDVNYVTEGGDQPFTRFEIGFDPDTIAVNQDGNAKMRGCTVRDSTNDLRCAEAQSRFGFSPFPRIEVPDVNLSGSADVVLDWKADIHAVQRTQVQYLARLDETIRLPILDCYEITDPSIQTGWTDERFRLESIEPREDDLAVLTFRSFNASV